MAVALITTTSRPFVYVCLGALAVSAFGLAVLLGMVDTRRAAP